MTKQVSGHCAVGKMMKHWNFWEESKCHSCSEPCKDSTSILYCPHPDWLRAWNASVQGIDEWMASVDIDPYIQHCIISALHHRDPSTKFCDYSDSPDVWHAALDQDCIGWDHFMKGCISKQWHLLQDDHYCTNSSKCTSHSWIEGLVSHILLLVHKQWTTRNEGVHAHTKKGIKIQEAAELESVLTNSLVSTLTVYYLKIAI